MNKKDFTFIVPAAGKSSRFKTKKSKIFYEYRNKILISYVIEQALKITEDTYVSTDCIEISRVARQWGAKTIERPHHLATDESNVRGTIAHFSEKVQSDIFVLLQPKCNFGVPSAKGHVGAMTF